MAGEAEHRVHGMGTALEVPRWPAITFAEAEAVLRRFPDAGRLILLRWHSPRPFSAAAILAAQGGEFLLKRHHCRLRTPAALAEEHGFMAHLRAGGVPVPEVLRAAGGAGAVAQGEWTYEVHLRSPGDDLYRERQSWTPFLSHGHAREAGAMLARLHGAARGFDAPDRGVHPLVSSFTIVPARDPLAAAEAYVAARPALAGFLSGKPWREELARLFALTGGGTTEGLADRLADCPPLWTHNDWHPSNLLWSADGRVRTVFDFGLAARTCALHDLATAIERSAIPWLSLSGDAGMAGDADAALAILSGYRSVLPLSGYTIETVLRLLPLVHIEFALSEIDYFAGILDDPAQAEAAWIDYLVGHAQWFVSPPGRAFLQRVREGCAA